MLDVRVLSQWQLSEDEKEYYDDDNQSYLRVAHKGKLIFLHSIEEEEGMREGMRDLIEICYEYGKLDGYHELVEEMEKRMAKWVAE